MKQTYNATAPDGTVFTRKSKALVSHAVLICCDGSWKAKNWCGRIDLAETKLKVWRETWNRKEAVIVPVDQD